MRNTPSEECKRSHKFGDLHGMEGDYGSKLRVLKAPHIYCGGMDTQLIVQGATRK